MRLNECRGVPVIKKGKMNGERDGRGRKDPSNYSSSEHQQRKKPKGITSSLRIPRKRTVTIMRSMQHWKRKTKSKVMYTGGGRRAFPWTSPTGWFLIMGENELDPNGMPL
jgi:hypothetical protein